MKSNLTSDLDVKSSHHFSKWLILYYLKKSKKGALKMNFPDGTSIRIGNTKSKPVEMKINHDRFFQKALLAGEIGFGEAFVDNDWDSEDLQGVIGWFLENSKDLGTSSGAGKTLAVYNLLGALNMIQHKLNRNTKKNSKRNISLHYDISNRFYSLMLDKTMTYSSGVFSKSDSLEESQIRKYDLICKKLQLQKQHRVLEIGCGWGGFSKYAATKYGCKIDAVTISREQFVYAKGLIEKNGLENQINLQFKDYRELKGKYDRIVSIEMAEALGAQYVDLFFSVCNQLLNDDGLMLMQCITMADPYFERYVRGTDWIQKYIFPGGCLLSHRQILNSLQKTGDLMVWDAESFGPDYAKTLSIWKSNFLKNLDKVKNLGLEEEFIRKWIYYLTICEVSFEKRFTNVMHFLISRPMNPNLNTRLSCQNGRIGKLEESYI